MNARQPVGYFDPTCNPCADAERWEDAVREAATTMQATPQQLAALYTGFISACLGSMGADFGQERAAQIAQIVTDNFKTMDFGREATKH